MSSEKPRSSANTTKQRHKRRYELRERARRQAQTRERIVAATEALHQEVGPAATTVAEIARRAGVSRLTVYNHFPDEGELFAACQQRFLGGHPLPDLSPALALTEPAARVREVLKLLYRSYREREPMTAKVLRDRAALPALDRLLSQTMDPQQAALADALAAGFQVKGPRAQNVRTLLALALEFWTWQRLAREGLGDEDAATLLSNVVNRAAG
jgi:AcrR family transcriptional regulator